MGDARKFVLPALSAATLGLALAACQSTDTPAAATAPAASVPAAAPPPSPPPAAAADQAPPAVPLLEQDVAYGEAQKRNLVGFLAMPRDAAEPLPGILLIHEWWGLNEEVRNTARRLAREGYVALAVDLYGGVTATAPDKAQALMTGVFADADGARRNLRQAYDYLDRYALSPRIASIGWDLGGSWALQTGLLFPDQLDAMVMFYGQVVHERSELSKLKLPILGFFGSEDKSILVRDVQDFRDTLKDLGKNAEIRIMIGADHGFADSTGGRYNERFAAEAWTITLEFLRRHLKLAEPAQ